MAIKQFLECGKIVSTHGVRGEVRVQHWCDTPQYVCDFSRLYLRRGETQLTVQQARVHKNMVLLKLEGYDSMDDAVTLRGQILYIDREDAPQDNQGGHFIQDLVGLSVIDADTGRCWGKVTDIWQTAANDVYEITGEDRVKRLIPAIRDVVLSVDIAGGSMTIRPLKGLFEDAD